MGKRVLDAPHFVRLHIDGLIGDTIRTIPQSGDELYISFDG